MAGILGNHSRRLNIEPLEDRRMLAVVTVNTELDVVDFTDGVTSLREAIFATNTLSGADTIEFDLSLSGKTLLLTQGELQINDSLTVNGPGADLLTIDAQGLSRIFHVTANLGDHTFNGLTLTGGVTSEDNESFGLTTYNGGAVYSQSTGLLTIESSHLEENMTKGLYAHGGAVFSVGDVTISNSKVSSNLTEGIDTVGGGISALGTIELTQSTIGNNRTEGQEFGYGGGIYGFGDVIISSSMIRENYTTGVGGLGGGAFIGGNLSLMHSTVSGNYTTGYYSPGGGIFVLGTADIGTSVISDNYTCGNSSGSGGIEVAGTATIANTTISGNYTSGSSSSGGGLSSGGVISIIASTVSGNVVSGSNSKGGGIFAHEPITVMHSTITDNHSRSASASSGGGGIWNFGTDLVLSDSIVSGNTTGSADPDITLGGAFSSWSVTVGFSVVGTEVFSLLSASSANNVFTDAPLLGSLQNNGGPTFTHALLPGSPAIDMGDPAAVAGVGDVPLADQRGGPYTRVYGGRVDIGAFEAQPLRADFDGDHDVDGRDFLAWQRGSGTAAPNVQKADGDADGDHDVDADDLAIWRAEYGLQQSQELPSLVVDTELDVVDPYDGLTSLREAIVYANGLTTDDTIEFDASLSGKTILLSQGEFLITDDLTINGLGWDLLTIDAGNGADGIFATGDGTRIFHIDDGDENHNILVSISGLTLTGGDLKGEDVSGSAVFAIESLALDEVAIVGNSVRETSGHLIRNGGGAVAVIVDDGSISITNSTFTQNFSKNQGVAAPAPITSALCIAGNGVMLISDSEFTNNESGARPPSWSSQGATIEAVACDGGKLTIECVNVSNNLGVGIQADALSGTVEIHEATIADNSDRGLEMRALNHPYSSALSSFILVEDSIISGHNVVGHADACCGGGAYGRLNGANTQILFRNTDFINNSARSGGAAFFEVVAPPASSIDLPIAKVRFEGGSVSYNHAEVSGGGISFGSNWLYPEIAAEFVGVEMRGNHAGRADGPMYPRQGGGAISIMSDTHHRPTTTFDLSITDSILVDNTTSSQGGALFVGDIPTFTLHTMIDNTIISRNSAAGGGGGIFIDGREYDDNSWSLVITDSQITENTAGDDGGGINVSADLNTSILIERSLIAGNTASGSGRGGGIALLKGDHAVITESTISDNYAGGGGGGIYADDIEMHVIASTVSGNEAGGYGGGIVAYRSSTQISQSTISYNHSAGGTGGLEVSSSSPIVHSTIVGNSTDSSSPGGVYRGKLVHSIVSGNTSQGNTPNDCLGSGAIYSIIGYQSSAGGETPPGTVNENGSMIGGATYGPIDPLLGPLQNNGGPTFTHALLLGSPAIDMGDPAAMAGVGDVPLADQRGGLYTRVDGGRIDIGAVESQSQHADFDGDGAVTGFDFLAWQRGFGKPAPLAEKSDGDADGDTDVDGADLAAWENAYGANVVAAPLFALVEDDAETLPRPQLVDLAGAAYLLNSGFGIRNSDSADMVRDEGVVRDEVFASLDESLRQDEDAAVVLAGEHLVDLTEDLAERDLAHERLQTLNDVPLGGELFPNL